MLAWFSFEIKDSSVSNVVVLDQPQGCGPGIIGLVCVLITVWFSEDLAYSSIRSKCLLPPEAFSAPPLPNTLHLFFHKKINK